MRKETCFYLFIFPIGEIHARFQEELLQCMRRGISYWEDVINYMLSVKGKLSMRFKVIFKSDLGLSLRMDKLCVCHFKLLISMFS